MSQNDIETETIRIRKTLPFLKGIESKILDGGFMPLIESKEEKQLYLSYFKNKYNSTPSQAKETKILYQTMYLLMSQYEVYN